MYVCLLYKDNRREGEDWEESPKTCDQGNYNERSAQTGHTQEVLEWHTTPAHTTYLTATQKKVHW